MVAKMKVMEVLLVAAIAMVGVATVSHAFDEPPAEFVIIQDGEGTIDPMAGTYTIQKGNDITLHMTAAEGYMLSMITVNGVITPFDDDSITLTIDDHTEIHVYFTSVEVDIPESRDFVYNGETIVAYDPMNPQYMVVGGSAKDVGEYTAKLILRHPDVAHWSDGTIEDKEVVWNIAPREISDAYFEEIGPCAYTGAEVEPALRPIAPLTADDYDVEYSDNVLPGTAHVNVTAKGNFVGSVTLEFEIVPASLLVKADDRAIVYGEDPRPYTYTIDGFVDGQDITDLEGTVNISCDYVPGDDVGTYDIVVSGLSSDNYDIVFQNGVLTVEQFELKREHFDIDTSDVGYDGTEKKKSVELKDGIDFIEEGSEYVVEHKDNRNAGIATIVITGKGNCKGVVTENFEIVAKAVTVHAVHKEKVYGQPDPALTVEIEGVIDGDTIDYTIDRAEGENVGAYVIDVSGEKEQGNYVVTFTDDHFVITPKDITFTSGTKDKVYDGTPLTYDSVTGTEGLEFDDMVEFTVTGSQTDVGTSDNTFTYLFTKGIANNYEIHLVFGKLTVKETLSTIVVTANSATKLYDGTALTEKGFTYTGTLADTDRLVVEIEGSITDVLYDNNEVSSVKNHVVSVKVMRGDVDVTENYSFGTHIDGKLKVTPRNVVLISDFNEKVYDGTALEDKHVEVLGDGFVNDSDASWTVTGSQTDVGSSKNTFTYALKDSVKGNYVVTKYEGTLTVTPKDIIVTADDVSKVYGAQDPELTYKVSGNGDLDVSGIVVDLEREAGEDVGVYDIIASGVKLQGNYSITFVGGKFTITPAKVIVTADDKTKVYGDDDPEFTVKIEGLLGDDEIEFNVSREVGEDVKTYTITPSGESKQGNYVVEYKTGILTITKRDLIFTGATETVSYTGKDQTLTGFTVEGLLSDHSYSGISYEAKGKDVGEYNGVFTGTAVVKKGNDDVTGNYNVITVPGKLIITKAAVDVPKAIEGLVYCDEVLIGVPEDTNEVVRYTLSGHEAALAGSYTAIATLNTGFVWSDGSSEPKSIQWSIAKREVTFIGASDAVIYDGTTKRITGITVEESETTGLVDGHVYSGLTYLAEGIVVGEYTGVFTHGTIKFLKGNDDVSANYAIVDYQEGKLTIEKADYDMSNIEFESKSFVYDGESKSLTIEGKLPVGEDDIGVTVRYEPVSCIDVGVYDVKAIFSTTSLNYNVPAEMTATLTITPMIVGISLNEDRFDFDGKEHTVEVELSGIKSRDGVITPVLSGNSVTSATNAGEYTVSVTKLDGDVKGNYALPEDNDLKWVIGARVLEEADFEEICPVAYNGSEQKPAVVSKNPLVTSDDYNVTYSNNTNVGVGIAEVKGIKNASGSVHIKFDIYATLAVDVNKVVKNGVTTTFDPAKSLSSFGKNGNPALFDLTGMYPGQSQSADMVAKVGGEYQGMWLGLNIGDVSETDKIDANNKLLDAIVLEIVCGNSKQTVTLEEARTSVINITTVGTEPIPLTVTMKFPHGENDNDLMGLDLNFKLTLCLKPPVENP